MAATSTIHDLGSDRRWAYTLPPRQALVCAWEQQVRGNWNTWEYARSKAPIKKTKRFLVADDLAVRRPRR